MDPGTEEQQGVTADGNALVAIMKDVRAVKKHDLVEIPADIGGVDGSRRDTIADVIGVEIPALLRSILQEHEWTIYCKFQTFLIFYAES